MIYTGGTVYAFGAKQRELRDVRELWAFVDECKAEGLRFVTSLDSEGVILIEGSILGYPDSGQPT
jgi:hypothetical protein